MSTSLESQIEEMAGQITKAIGRYHRQRVTFVELISELADGTRTAKQIAEMIGTSAVYVSIVAKDCGLALAKGKHGPKPGSQNAERLRYIISAIERRETLQSIGDKLGITRERVRQIAAKAGVTSFAHADAVAKRAAEENRKKGKAERKKAVAREMTEMVKAGMSIRQAGIALGLTASKTETVSRRARLGKVTRHGRWPHRKRGS